MEEVNYDSIIQLNRLENKTEEILIKLQNHWNRMDAISREIGILSRSVYNDLLVITVTSSLTKHWNKEERSDEL